MKQNTEIKTDDFDSRLRNLFSYNDEPNPFNPEETDQLIEDINNAKILDPACGSGAFPMGVLHKMVYLLQKLDPGNVKWKAQQKEKIIGNQIKELEKDKKAITGLSDKAVREKAIQAVDERLKEIDEIFESKNNFDDYARKLYLIENCIYGIDIQPIAVQISKLRFFISLIIDQDKNNKKDNLGLRSLPNLETKFVAANTLISLEIPTTDLFSENNPIKVLQEELKATRHEYFNAKTRKDKLRLQQQDKALRKKIAAQISDTLINKKEEEIANLEKQLAEAKKKLTQIDNGAEQKETIESTNIFGETETIIFDKKKEKIKAQKSTISFIEKQINSLKAADNKDAIQKVAQQISSFDPYDQNHFANWFEPEWMFGNEVNSGFDIVIGNPPYGGKYSEIEKKYFKLNYESAKTLPNKQKGSLDTFTLFIEQGFNSLRKNGCLTFIVPISITSSDSMTGIHNLLERNCEEIKVSSYAVRPQPVFQNAVVNTSILFFTKTETKCKRILATKMYRKSNDISLEQLVKNLEFIDVINYRLIGRYPKISYDIERKILDKIFSQKTSICELQKLTGKKIYYRFAGGRYFKVVTNYSTGSSAERAICFDKKIANCIGAILSSNLYFWFYQIYSDNLNLKAYEIESFKIPLEKLTDKQIETLEKLYEAYLKDIEANSNVRQTTRYANIDSFREYKIGKSKSLIDKIDDFICPLYGLTQEETDYLKNYEIAYRMTDDD